MSALVCATLTIVSVKDSFSVCLPVCLSAPPAADQTCKLFRTTRQDNSSGGSSSSSSSKVGTLGPAHTEGLNDVAWLSNCGSSTVATASDDKLIKIWDVETVGGWMG